MLRLALPALAEETLVLAVTWTDWFLASRYFVDEGDATKAAMGLVAYLMWLIPSFFSVVAIGATALIARWVGAGDLNRARLAANQALLAGILFVIGLIGISIRTDELFVGWMQLKGSSANYALEYIRILIPMIPFIMFSQVGAACLRGAGDTFTGFGVKCIVVVINIVVSTALVTGWGLFPQFGWKGIAIGTASGYFVGGAIILAVLFRGRAGIQWKAPLLKPDWEILRKMFRIGLPGGFDISVLLFSQLLFLALINSLGKASAAAHGLAVQIEACAFLPGAAFQAAAATIAGQFLGAGRPDRATKGVLLCLFTGGAIMLGSGGMLYFFGPNIASFFTNDPNHPTTIQVAELLKVIAFVMPCLAAVMIISGGFRGAGDTVWPLFFTVIGFFVLRIPLAVYFAFAVIEIPILEVTFTGWGLGVAGAWYAMAADLVIRSLMIFWRFRGEGWKKIEI